MQYAAELRKRHGVSRKKLKQIVGEVSQLTGLRDVGSSRKYLHSTSMPLASVIRIELLESVQPLEMKIILNLLNRIYFFIFRKFLRL